MNDNLSTLALLVFAVCIYFIPSLVGWNKGNHGAIVALNLLLGWTVVGWVVALVWALTNDPESSARQAVSMPAPASQPTEPEARIARLKDLRDRGTISQEEFLEALARM